MVKASPVILASVAKKEMEEAIRERRLLLKQLKEVRQSLRLLAKTRPRVRCG